MNSITIGLLACLHLFTPTAGSATVTSKPAVARSAPRGVGGLMPVKALPALPTGAVRPHPGYPGSELRAGVFLNAGTWSAFVARAGRRYGQLKIDWQREMVAYVVFTGQTNHLRFVRWVAPKANTAHFVLHWSGIEPFYATATPGLFRVVPRQGVRWIKVRQATQRFPARDLVTVAVP